MSSKITITIEGVEFAPTWTMLQNVISDALGNPTVLVRIRRRDKGCDYRGLGEYDLRFQEVTEYGSEMREAVLIVKP